MRSLRTALLATLSLAAGTVAQAQTFTGTGIASNVVGGLDTRWEVSCRALNASQMGATPCHMTAGSEFTNASVVTVAPGGWANVPAGPNGVRYISAWPNASAGNTNGENEAFEFRFRTTFWVDAADAPYTQLVLSNLRFDNYWVGYVLNGTFSTGDVSPTPLVANGANWATPFSMIINSGFVPGLNTIYFKVRGNGATDGLLVDGRLNVVPEPSTYALMATGLLGLGVVARRRKVSAART